MWESRNAGLPHSRSDPRRHEAEVDVQRSIATLIALLALTIAALSGCQQPPEVELVEAARLLAQADVAGARIYAEARFREAESTLREARLETSRQSGRLAPLRDYARADSLVADAARAAEEARLAAQNLIRDYDEAVMAARDRLDRDIGEWRENIAGTLLRNQVERFLNEAELAAMTCARLHRLREYDAALAAIDGGKDSMRRLAEAVSAQDADSERRLHVWRRWVAETLEESRRKRDWAIVVVKRKHKTYLVKNGELVSEHDCELGYNAGRQKLFSGDGATPEGRYRVTAVRHTGSKFHKALMLDYPNQTDRARFAENKEKGVISPSARIGGLIEVHGHMGRGADWTDGCVALSNEDMDRIMDNMRVGTPVTIVRRSDTWP